MSLAYISLGSNIGNGRENLRRAWQLLSDTKGITVLALSDPYITRPVIKSEWEEKSLEISEKPFTNAVGALETTLDPYALLNTTSAIEKLLGRDRNASANRTLDLDLIYFDDQVLSGETLIVPHPEMHKRHFVLTPLAQLAPDRIHPINGMSTSEMLRCLPLAGKDVIVRSHWAAAENAQ